MGMNVVDLATLDIPGKVEEMNGILQAAHLRDDQELHAWWNELATAFDAYDEADKLLGYLVIQKFKNPDPNISYRAQERDALKLKQQYIGLIDDICAKLMPMILERNRKVLQ